MIADKLMLMALVACGLFVNSSKAVPSSELDSIVDSRSYARYLHLKDQKSTIISLLLDYVDSMDCPNGDLVSCMQKNRHFMQLVYECVAIMMDMAETIDAAHGSIKSAEDIFESKLLELEAYQGEESTRWSNSNPKREAVSQVIHQEAKNFFKILRDPRTEDQQLNRKCAVMNLKAWADKVRGIVRLVDYVKDMKCDESNLLSCIGSNAHINEKVGDVVSLAKLEGEMKALKEGRVKDAKDFIRGAIEGLEETKKQELLGTTYSRPNEQKLVDVFGQVFHKELDQSISFLSSLL